MINEKELPGFISENMPELSHLCDGEKNNVYGIVRQLFNHTLSLVIQQNLDAAKRCMDIAEQLYNTGNHAVKNAIENIYVYCFTRGFFAGSKDSKEIQKIIPLSLYELYNRQLTAHL